MIVRGERPERYVVLDNNVVRDGRLSFKARGILAYLLSQPPSWRSSAARIARTGPDGRDAVLTALSELERVGYIVRRREQDERGRWRTVTVVYDSPEVARGAAKTA